MGDLTANFNRVEFACKCGCGKDDIKDALAVKVQAIRDLVKRPIRGNSGIRCDKHNANTKAKPTSIHIDEWAADHGYAESAERYEQIEAAVKVFNRIGIAKTFIHVDVDPNKSPRVVWLYS